MFDRKKCKLEAKALFSENKKVCVLSGLVLLVVSLLVGIPFYISELQFIKSDSFDVGLIACFLAITVLVALILPMFNLGQIMFLYNVKKGTAKDFKDFWSCLKGKTILVVLYLMVRLWLWMLLFFAVYFAGVMCIALSSDYSKLLLIPGFAGIVISIWIYVVLIQKAIAYGCLEYEYCDNPDEKITVSFKKAVEYSKGNKWAIFVLELSFIGWGLLCALTLGVLSIWVGPYISLTYINMWDSIKADKNRECIEKNS